MSLPDRFHDRAIEDVIATLRYEAGLSGRVAAHFRGLERDLLAALAALGDDPSTASQRRLKAVLKEAKEAIEDRLGTAAALMGEEMKGFAAIKTDSALTLLNGAIGVDLGSATFTAEQLEAIASDVLIEGAPSAEWWALQESEVLRNFTNRVRAGMSQGLTPDKIAREVRDMMGITTRQAQTLVRTSVLSVNNAAHMAVYEQNLDIIKGVAWVSTLDARTTPICQGLDGLQWEFKDGVLAPDGHDKQFPGPTAHWGCRSTQIPVTRSWEELARAAGGDPEAAKVLDGMSVSDRASMDGPVSGKLTYETWLKGKDEAFQREVLGPARFRLWSKGKLGLGDLTNQAGHELTLDELTALIRRRK
jgi:SPP1 gp7 family putative phage head morphogenesis protein